MFSETRGPAGLRFGAKCCMGMNKCCNGESADRFDFPIPLFLAFFLFPPLSHCADALLGDAVRLILTGGKSDVIVLVAYVV